MCLCVCVCVCVCVWSQVQAEVGSDLTQFTIVVYIYADTICYINNKHYSTYLLSIIT